ncbi:hypothetical protein V6N13_052093 [Hibiscus sabdariffa]
MLGLVTWTVRVRSALMLERLILKEVSLMEMRWKVGSLGLALMRAVAAIAEAAPTKAEVQLQLTLLGIGFCGNSILNFFLRLVSLEKLRAKKGEIDEKNGRWI